MAKKPTLPSKKREADSPHGIAVLLHIIGPQGATFISFPLARAISIQNRDYVLRDGAGKTIGRVRVDLTAAYWDLPQPEGVAPPSGDASR